MVSFLHTSRSSTASLSSVKFIPDIVCISSIHFFLGQPLFLHLLPHASIISFSIPFARITWPKNIIFYFAVLCLSDKTLACPISISIDSFVLFSVQETLSIFLHIHISQASILVSISLVFVHVSQPYSITGKIIAFTIRVFVCKLACLSFHIFSRPCIATFPSVILPRISFS